MDGVKHVGSLQIEQDLKFQQRDWRLQRAGWALMALILLLAAGGLFGRGPLAHASAGDAASGLTIRYERIERRHADSSVRIEVAAPAAPANEPLRLIVDSTWLENAGVQQILPAPSTTQIAGSRVVYLFERSDAGDGAPTRITLQLQPEAFGRIHGRIGLQDGPQLELTQFVLP